MRRDEHQLAYAQWVGNLCHEEELPHFDASGVERLIEFGVRQAGDRDKVLASYAAIADLVREAAFWARKEDRQLVSARHVEKALESHHSRSQRRHLVLRRDVIDAVARGRFHIYPVRTIDEGLELLTRYSGGAQPQTVGREP